jgi:hypothetical protein
VPTAAWRSFCKSFGIAAISLKKNCRAPRVFVPITITNIENKTRRQLITTHQPAAKFRTNRKIARFMVGSLAWFRLNFLSRCFPYQLHR